MLRGVCVVVVVSIGSVSLARGQPAPRIDARITVAHGINDGRPGSSADAVFAPGPLFGPVLASDGPCRLHRRAVSKGLSAGTLAITGTTQPITLLPSWTATGLVEYRRSEPVPNPAFARGSTITVEASGGSDIPAFTASVVAPPPLVGYVPPTSLSRNGHTMTWAPHAGTEILILIVALDVRLRGTGVIVCRVADSGVFTVPASTFALLPDSIDRALVSFFRVAETTQRVGDAQVAFDVMTGIGVGPLRLFPATLDLPETSPSSFLNLGFGLGSHNSLGSRFQLGQRLGRRLHLVEELHTLDATPSTLVSESELSFSVGVRWMLFEPRPRPTRPVFLLPGKYFARRALYATATAGANLLERVTQTSETTSKTTATAWSPMTSLALGSMPVRGLDWEVGIELRYQLAFPDGDLQQRWTLLFAVQID